MNPRSLIDHTLDVAHPPLSVTLYNGFGSCRHVILIPLIEQTFHIFPPVLVLIANATRQGFSIGVSKRGYPITFFLNHKLFVTFLTFLQGLAEHAQHGRICC